MGEKSSTKWIEIAGAIAILACLFDVLGMMMGVSPSTAIWGVAVMALIAWGLIRHKSVLAAIGMSVVGFLGASTELTTKASAGKPALCGWQVVMIVVGTIAAVQAFRYRRIPKPPPGAPLLIGVLLLAGPAAADITWYSYLYPAVAKVYGAAGTDWRTEVCLVNLGDRDLSVKITIGMSEDTTWVSPVVVPVNRTLCFPDIIGQKFPMQSFTGWMIIEARPEDNYGHDEPVLLPSVKIYNYTDQGTYGQEIEPADPLSWFGNLIFVGTATGVQNNQSFRTNIGLISVDAAWQEITVNVYNTNGQPVYELEYFLPPLGYYQFRIPPEIQVTNGTVLIESDGFLTGYVSVVDNLSGDGLSRIPMVLDLRDVNGAAPPSGEPARTTHQLIRGVTSQSGRR